MLSWIIQFTIISIVFIFLLDHLIKFFTNTLTVPKIKDLVNNTNKKYDSIYEILSKSSLNSSSIPKDWDIIENSTDILNLPSSSSSSSFSSTNNEKKEDMKNELKYFFKNQLSGHDLGNKENTNPEYFQFR